MRRVTRIIQGLLALGFAFSMLAMQPARPVLAFPPLPSSFYGTIQVNAANVSDGTVVSARINGVQYASTLTFTYLGNSFYVLDIPGDDSTTPGTLEGGLEADTIIFSMGGVEADQTGSWKSGTNIKMDLTSSTTATLIPPQATSTPAVTETARNVVTPATATATTRVQSTPTLTQTAIIVFSTVTFTPAIRAQVTPTSIVRAQASSTAAARLEATQAIPTETNPENAIAHSSPTMVDLGILALVGILISSLWFIKRRKPKELK